jgi:hypothetical protein
MTARSTPGRHAAFTMVELSVVIVTLVMLAIGLILPAMTRDRGRHPRINCVNNLKNIGLSYRIFATDNDGKFPWQVAPKAGGVMPPAVNEVAGPTNSVLFMFAAVSNELSTPKIVVCSEDRREKLKTNTWSYATVTLASNLQPKVPSYFLGLTATEEQPQSILGGDRNLTNISHGLDFKTPGSYNRLVHIPAADAKSEAKLKGWGWTEKHIHKKAGNLLLGDGSVQQTSDGRARDQLRDALNSAGDQQFLFPGL